MMINKHFFDIFANLVQSLHAKGLNDRLKAQPDISFHRPLYKYLLAGLFLLCLSLSTHAQNYLSIAGNAIRKGDAKALALCFDQRIDLTFSDKTTTCSRKQAELIIRKFFSKVEPTNFTNPEQGDSHRNNTKFLIGYMTTSNGVYKVYLFFVLKKGTYVVRELRFEK